MIDTTKLLQDTNIIEIVSRYLPLKKEGAEHKGICPFHEDDKASLQVNEKKQIYKCFACDAGGDVIDFVQRSSGGTFLEACTELKNGSDNYDIASEKRPTKKPKLDTWQHVSPAPILEAGITHYSHGTPNSKWVYHDDKGLIIGYICRFDKEDGKVVLPYCYATDGKRSEWRWMGFNKPRPLYNLHLIHLHPNASIVLVEGEKTADAVQSELITEKTICTTWIGGANGLVNADFGILKGRNVIFWADNDTEQRYGDKHAQAGKLKPWNEQPGNKAMLEINEQLKQHCTVRKWVNIPDVYPHKWDAADKDWTAGELREFIRDNMAEIPTIEKAKKQEAKVVEMKPKIPAKLPSPPLVSREDNPLVNNGHFKLLGYDKDENMHLVYYFFSFDAKTTIKLSPPSMNTSNLMTLAPINWWEDNFPAKSSKVDATAAQQFLIFQSHRIGMFKEKFIRGRGAWVDEDRFVIHTGDELIVNEVAMPLRQISSKYVYEVGEKMGLGNDVALPTSESSKLTDKIKWLKWERKINAYLMTGWCVIAPFCGVLKWRPHVWVTGAAGSGKSWTMENIVRRLLGEAAIVVQGKTTEAGVRGLVQNDARAVLFDESDVDSHNDRERIQNIIALARSSSYHDGGVIGKGTQSGASRTYTMRSCFAFSSIGVQLNQQSDRSRFTMLSLVPFEGKGSEADFVNFEKEWNKLVTYEYVQKLQARTIKLLPVILKNSRTFADAVSQVIGQRRIGDQVGGMLAGAYSLNSRHEISLEDAVEWVKERDWEEEKGMELTKDEFQLFTKIMGHSLAVESNHGRLDRTVGELILIGASIINEPGLSDYSASNRLRRIGIIVNDDKIFISNTADGVKAIIRNTSWANNHYKILDRLPGAEKVAPRVYYPGCNSRGISIPMAMISDGFETTKEDAVKFTEEPPEGFPF